MPEILEESAQAVCGAGWVGVWRPLLCIIGSARPVAFPMHLHLRCLPQLPSVWKEWRVKRDLRWNWWLKSTLQQCVHREPGLTSSPCVFDYVFFFFNQHNKWDLNYNRRLLILWVTGLSSHGSLVQHYRNWHPLDTGWYSYPSNHL